MEWRARIVLRKAPVISPHFTLIPLRFRHGLHCNPHSLGPSKQSSRGADAGFRSCHFWTGSKWPYRPYKSLPLFPYCASHDSFLLTSGQTSCCSMLRKPELKAAEILYCFLNALLLITKRTIPTPSRSRVTGHGKGQPKSGFGMPANMVIESMTNNTPAIIRSHFDAVSMFSLFSLSFNWRWNAFAHSCVIYFTRDDSPSGPGKAAAGKEGALGAPLPAKTRFAQKEATRLPCCCAAPLRVP